MFLCPKFDLGITYLPSYADHCQQLERRKSWPSLYKCEKCCFCDESPEERDKHMENCTGNRLEKNKNPGKTMNVEASDLNNSNNNNEASTTLGNVPCACGKIRIRIVKPEMVEDESEEEQSSSSSAESAEAEISSDDVESSSSSDGNQEDRSSTNHFKCTDCLKTFRTSKDLQDHHQQGSKGFKCKKCCTSFQIPRLYEKHVKKCKGKQAESWIFDNDDSDNNEDDDNSNDALSTSSVENDVEDNDSSDYGDPPILKPSVRVTRPPVGGVMRPFFKRPSASKDKNEEDEEEEDEEEEDKEDDDLRYQQTSSPAPKKKKKSFVCPECKQKFEYQCWLTRHLSENNTGKTFKCGRCCKSFVTKGACLNHRENCDGKLQLKQSGNNNSKHKVKNVAKQPQTNKTSSDSNQASISSPAKQTLEEEQTSNRTKYVCPECKRKFKHRSNLSRHLLRERNRGKFKCGKCCSSFVQNRACLSHRRDCDGKLQLKQSKSNNCKDEVNKVATQGPTNKSSSGSNQPSTSGSAKRTLEEDQTFNRKKSKSDNRSKENHSNMGETDEASSTTTATPIRNDQASLSSSQESTSQRVALQKCNEDDFAIVFGTRTSQENEPASNRADPEKDIIAPLDLSRNQPDQSISQADVDVSLQQEEIPRQCHVFPNTHEPSTSDAGGNRSTAVESDGNGVKFFPIKSLMKIWNINDNYKNDDSELHRMLLRIFYEMEPDVMKPEEVITFLQKKPENWLGYQIISIILIDLLRQMDVREVISLYTAGVNVKDGISESFLSIIESLIVLKVQSQVNPSSPEYLQLEQITLLPVPVQNRILNRISSQGNTSVYDFIKDAEELLNIICTKTISQSKNEESVKSLALLFDMKKSWTNRCIYWQELCNKLLQSLTTSANQTSLKEILLEHSRLHQKGTVAYANMQWGHDVSNTLHLHPEILQRYTNYTEKVTHNDLPKITASLSDQRAFRYLLYGPKSNLNEAVTFAVYEIAKAVKIKEIWKFLFPYGIEFKTYSGQNREDIFQIALSLDQKDALCEIVKVFDHWIPHGCREDCLSTCDEQQLIQFFGRDDIALDEWEKYQMILHWAHHKCQKKCLSIKDTRFDKDVDEHFRKVLKVLRLKPLQHYYNYIKHHGYIRLHEWQTFFDKQASERWDETGLFSLPRVELNQLKLKKSPA